MRSGKVPCQAVWRLRNSTGIVSKAAEVVPAKSISLLKYVAKDKLYQTQWVSERGRAAFQVHMLCGGACVCACV